MERERFMLESAIGVILPLTSIDTLRGIVYSILVTFTTIQFEFQIGGEEGEECGINMVSKIEEGDRTVQLRS